MSQLIYAMLVSADGYVRDTSGAFDWAEPDDDVLAFVNERARAVGTSLLGRRMYEVMSFWEDSNEQRGMALVHYEFGSIWRAMDKTVFSTTLDLPTTARTRMERSFDPDAIRALKESSPLDIEISGPTLAAQAIAAGLVDEFQMYRCPIAVGGGLPFFPHESRMDLALADVVRFASGIVWERYVPRAPSPHSRELPVRARE